MCPLNTFQFVEALLHVTALESEYIVHIDEWQKIYQLNCVQDTGAYQPHWPLLGLPCREAPPPARGTRASIYGMRHLRYVDRKN